MRRSSRIALATWSRFVVTIPPSPAATFFVAYNEKQVAADRPPIFLPRYALSTAWAASSITGRPSSQSGSRSQTWPARCTGRIAFVRSVTAPATSFESRLRSESRTSTKTGFAPVWTITFAVAGQVIGVVITSSRGPTSSATSARVIAAVPDETARAYFAPVYSAKRRSNSAAFSAVVSQPERIVRATASISSSPTAGGWKESMVLRLGRSCCTRPEAYESGARPRPSERCVPRRADGLNRADTVGASAELVDDEARTPVDPDADDPLGILRAVDGFDVFDFSGLGCHEDRGSAPDQAARLRLGDMLTQSSGDRERVEVDAEGGVAELRVVAPYEARRHLDHLWALHR